MEDQGPFMEGWRSAFDFLTVVLVGQATIEETKRSTAFRDKGKVPTLTEYLRYRCCSIGHMPVLTLVAVESSIW